MASAPLIQFHWATLRDSGTIVILLILGRPHLKAKLLRYLWILMV